MTIESVVDGGLETGVDVVDGEALAVGEVVDDPLLPPPQAGRAASNMNERDLEY